MKIEQSLNQLQQLFIDMAVLVAEQSEMITSIEVNIENATGYMKEATGQLKKANKLAKRGRKVRPLMWHYCTTNPLTVHDCYYRAVRGLAGCSAHDHSLLHCGPGRS